MKKQVNWLTGKVIYGAKLGRTLGYPTVNLENPNVMKEFKKGVYAAKVKINNTKIYKAALYFGPKYILDKPKLVIEIFLFDFSGDLYDDTILFHVVSFIRPPIRFPSIASLKQQITQDCQAVQTALQ